MTNLLPMTNLIFLRVILQTYNIAFFTDSNDFYKMYDWKFVL